MYIKEIIKTNKSAIGTSSDLVHWKE